MSRPITMRSGIDRTWWQLLALVVLSVAVLALAGCSGEEKKPAPKAEKAPAQATQASGGEGQLPPGHSPMDKMAEDIQKMSHSNIKTSKEVNISDEVRNTWTDVTLEITDYSSQATATVPFKVGSDVKLNDEGLRMRVDSFVPDYAIVENRIESRSNEPNNPAVLLEVISGEEVLTRGWVFRDLPEFNSFNDPRFGVKLLTPEAGGGAAE